MFLDVLVEDRKVLLDILVVLTDGDEGEEVAVNFIEMVYSEVGMDESTLEEFIIDSFLKIVIVLGIEFGIDEI